MATVTRIDNVNPDIVYSGVWTRHDSQTGYNNTISLTRRVGNSATLNFIGNSIAVYGMLGPHPPDAPAITTYQIDGGDPTTYAPPSPTSQQMRLLFYQSPPLSEDGGQVQPPSPQTSNAIPPSPTLDVTLPITTSDRISSQRTSGSASLSATSSQSTSRNPDQSSPSATISPVPSSETTQTSRSFSPNTLPIDAPTFIASAQDTSQSTTPSTATVLGGVLGGVFSLVILSGIFFLCLRKRRKKAAHNKYSPEASASNLIQSDFTNSSMREVIYRPGSDNEPISATSTSSTGPPSAPWTTDAFLSPVRNTGVLPPSKANVQEPAAHLSEVPLPPYSA
ncbi:hypothetical protein CVT24_000563 [Panaeolus cyanescens]|uniref:Uncharacterized protein n=1 Tax=Panaeolus cyanescens TaxID=181874 RepID=A0A409W6Z8_9AGAR|nr:hypothetical protein CVT24_000563 [Panaeolus cyanescens]